MKIIGIEDKEEIIKKLNKKKLIITISIIIATIIFIILASLYIANTDFREFIDFTIFRKEAIENKVKSIEIEDTSNIYAYDKYIVILKDNVLTHYSVTGKEENKLDIQISNPIVDVNNKYLLIGEKEKQKLYLVSEGNKIWEKDVEGNILRMSVNKNGYVAVIISGTTHKSVIEIYDNDGKKIFKTYLSNTIAMDADISNDNKYMSFAEINTNGTVVSSRVKTISIEKAKEGKEESIVNTYEQKENSIILNIKYQESNKLACIYDNQITVMENGKEEKIIDLNDDSKVNFADIELDNHALKITDKSTLFHPENKLEIVNINNKKMNLYTLKGVAKEVYCVGSTIAMNLGSEIYFVGSNGWLIKKYSSSQQIKGIVINNNFAGIIYRDKIEIVNL